MWPTSFALKELTAAEEARLGVLVKKAVSEDRARASAGRRIRRSNELGPAAIRVVEECSREV